MHCHGYMVFCKQPINVNVKYQICMKFDMAVSQYFVQQRNIKTIIIMILIKQHLYKLSCGYRGYRGKGGSWATQMLSICSL